MEKISFIWQILAMLGFWVPVKKSLPNPKYFDWVIVSWEDNTGFRGVPKVAEYGNFGWYNAGWHLANDDANQNEYFRMCKVTHWHRLPRNKWDG